MARTKAQDRTNLKDERVTVLLSPLERRTLEILADEEMGTMSEFIRRLVWREARRSGAINKARQEILNV